MRHLKSFNESLKTNTWLDGEFSSQEEIVQMIWSYLNQHRDQNISTYNLEEFLADWIPDFDWETSVSNRENISRAVSEILSKPRISSGFIEYMEEIFSESRHGVEIEEIEDLFLDSDYKYSIQKTNQDDKPSFWVKVESVPAEQLQNFTNRIYNTIDKRLPAGWQVVELKIKRRVSQVDFTLIISKIEPTK